MVLGTPCVAHLTWPMPTFPSNFCFERFDSKASTLPSHLTSFIKPLYKVAIHAVSYPLYSNFLKVLIIELDTFFVLVIPIIPHIYFFLL